MTAIPQQPVYVLIPAGGVGERFGGAVKKQFMTLGGLTLLERSLAAFDAHHRVEKIVVALPADELSAREDFAFRKVTRVAGGSSRAESVKKAFEALGTLSDEAIVLVHDAVRPLVSSALIDRVIAGVAEFGTALPVVPLSDTIKRVVDGRVAQTVDREFLRAAQTPQGGRFGIFRRAYERCGGELTRITDEAMLFESVGQSVMTVAGDPRNLKVTTSFDLDLAEVLLTGGLH